jgi:hypothetical protein
MSTLGKTLMLVGGGFLIAGGIIYLLAWFRVPLGKLPGDIIIRFENISCVFPLATSILISVLLTIILNILARTFKR